MREIDAYTRGLVAGLAEMSSDCCVNGPSRLTAFCYGLDTFKAELSLEIGPDAQLFEQPSDEIVLMETLIVNSHSEVSSNQWFCLVKNMLRRA